MAKRSRAKGIASPGRADRESVSRDDAMTHTLSSRTRASATGHVQAKVGQKQRRAADQDLGFRIRNDLNRALEFYPITSKHVSVLSALISFLGDQTRVVFASNRKLSVRLHHLPERTLSRQVKILVEQGFIRRVMSPNGKRWARRKENGGIVEAFGLDISPFFERAPEFAERAAEAIRRQEEVKAARLRLSLLRERLEEFGAVPKLVEEIRRERRRVPCPATLERLEGEAEAALAELGQPVDNSTQTPPRPEEMASNDSQNGLHQQTRNDRVYSLPLREGSPDAGWLEEKDGGNGNWKGPRSPLPVLVDETAEPPISPLAEEPASTESSASADRSGTEPRIREDTPAEASEDGSNPSSQTAMAEYVQSVLAGFRSKLRTSASRSLQLERSVALPTKASSAGPSDTGPLLSLQDQSSPNSGFDRSRGWQPVQSAAAKGPSRSPDVTPLPSLEAVLSACPESLSLVGQRPRTWSEMFEAAWRLGRCIQIADEAMARACAALGRDGLAVTLFGLCERHATIRQPAAYLRSLCGRPGFNPAELLRFGPGEPCS